MSTDEQEIQVIVSPGLQGPLNDWLASRGLYLHPIPIELDTDLPTFGIGVTTEGAPDGT